MQKIPRSVNKFRELSLDQVLETTADIYCTFAVLVGYYRLEAAYIALCLAQRNAGPACHKVSSCDEAFSMPNLKLNKKCNK